MSSPTAPPRGPLPPNQLSRCFLQVWVFFKDPHLVAIPLAPWSPGDLRYDVIRPRSQRWIAPLAVIDVAHVHRRSSLHTRLPAEPGSKLAGGDFPPVLRRVVRRHAQKLDQGELHRPTSAAGHARLDSLLRSPHPSLSARVAVRAFQHSYRCYLSRTMVQSQPGGKNLDYRPKFRLLAGLADGSSLLFATVENRVPNRSAV